jgi:hypothetical protein
VRFQLVIDEVAPSPNTYLYRHWRYYKAVKDKWRWLVHIASIASGKPSEALPRSKVGIMRYGRLLLDPDNLVGAHKPVVDALKNNGFILDDTGDHIELDVRQEKVPKGAAPCTLIVVESI